MRASSRCRRALRTRRCRTPPHVSQLLGAALTKAEARLPGEKGRRVKALVEEEARLHDGTGREAKDEKPCSAAAPAQCMSRALRTLRPHIRCHRCRRFSRLLLCCILHSADIQVAPVDAVAPLASAEVDAGRAELCAAVRLGRSLMASMLSQTRRAPCRRHFHVPPHLTMEGQAETRHAGALLLAA